MNDTPKKRMSLAELIGQRHEKPQHDQMCDSLHYRAAAMRPTKCGYTQMMAFVGADAEGR